MSDGSVRQLATKAARKSIPQPGDAQQAVWLDCDPGHDDAMAILLAGYNPCVNLLGISTVHGNQSVAKTTVNALACLRAFGMDSDNLPVVRGQARPLVRPPTHCAEIHGETGLDNLEGEPLFPLPRDPDAMLEPGKCVNVMYEHISRAANGLPDGQRVKLVATGALTNVALLLTLYPELVEDDVLEVVFMGGAIGLGNTGPVAEFNMQIDPEAAKVVFESGAKVTMVPLEVTHTALATEAVMSEIREDGSSEFRNALCDLLSFFKDTYKSYFGFDDPPLHDPCAVAYVIDPDLFETEDMRVDVETHSDLAAGQTVCDRHNLQKKPKNATVACTMDVEEFWDLIHNAIYAAEKKMDHGSKRKRGGAEEGGS